jgi:hypothetical protein
MALATLPTELVQAIVPYLDLADIQSFRLTCLRLKHQSLHPFKDRFFRQLTLSWNIKSFNQLLKIVSHQHFGPALQDLIIDATPWFAMQLWQLSKRIEDMPDPEGYDPKLMEARIAVGQEAGDLARFWNEEHFDRKTLTAIFEVKKQLRNITFAYHGMDKSFGKFARKYCDTSQNEMSRPFVITMTAIATAGLVVHSIKTDTWRRHGAVSIGRLESLAPHLRNLDVPIANLQTLELNLRDWRYPEAGFEVEGDRAPFVVRFLSKCKNVSDLKLSCFSSLDGDLLSEMAKHCEFRNLQRCTLELFRLSSANDLFEFLEPSKDSLQRLSMGHIVLRDDSTTWAEVICRIASTYDHLAFLELRTLFNKMGSRVGFHHSVVGTLVVEGGNLRENVEASVDGLVNGNWGPAWHLAAVAYPFIGMRT